MTWRAWLLAIRQRYQLNRLGGPVLWERRAELIALALGVLLFLVLTLGFVFGAALGGVNAVPPSASLLKVTALQEAADLKAEQREELLARPLFWQSRRPVAPPPVVVAAHKPSAPKAQPLKGVELIGVFGSQEALGLIARVDGRVLRIAPGQTVKGWQMAGYDEGVARFVQGAQVRTLKLPLTTPTATGNVANVGAEDEPSAATAGGIGFGGSVSTTKRRRKK